MHGQAERWTRRLRRELDCPRLLVRWREDICRFQVGERLPNVGGDINWFYTVSDGEDGFRPLDMRTVFAIADRDVARWGYKTPKAYVAEHKDAAEAKKEKWREEAKYKAKHELRRRFLKELL